MKWKFWKKDKPNDEGWLYNRKCGACDVVKLVNISGICRDCRNAK